MGRPLFAAFAVVVAAGVAIWAGRSPPAVSNEPIVAAPPTSMAASPLAEVTREPVTAGIPVPTLPTDDEASLMARLRRATPPTMLALARDGNRRFPGSREAEEREARAIDALVALDDIGEAHTEAMLFVQHHPSGPFTAHIANVMGVHPRPPGAVPEPPATPDRRP
jgi:hypothetical protein